MHPSGRKGRIVDACLPNAGARLEHRQPSVASETLWCAASGERREYLSTPNVLEQVMHSYRERPSAQSGRKTILVSAQQRHDDASTLTDVPL